MSRPRFLADQDLMDQIVTGVLRREPAIEFLRARALGMAAAPDERVLEYAADEELIVVSHDVNTMPDAAYRRLDEGLPMAGLIMVRQQLPVRTTIDNLVLVWSSSETEEWEGTVTFLPF